MAKEYITLAGLAKEFIELVDETATKYNNGDDKEREAIVKEIKDTGADLFNFFGEELSEVLGEAGKRFQEAAEETDEFFKDMHEVYDVPDSRPKHPFSPVLAVANSAEQWNQQVPVPGDHIRVTRLGGVYAHHGIYIGDDTVIHFAPPAGSEMLDWNNAKVRKTSLNAFLKAGQVEVRLYSEEEKANLYPVEQIISNARASLGSGNYNLIFNNCEHFANACTLGKYRSPQVEEFFNKVTNFLE